MSRKATLAIVMIVKNEAVNLRACLDSAKGFADEIIVVDGGSTDETVAIAREYTDKVYVHAVWPGFGRQRQIAQDYATAEYVFRLDADERFTPELKASIDQVLASPEPNTLYSVAHLTWAFGRFIRHCGWYPDRVIRLYPTRLARYNDSAVHEELQLNDQMRIKGISGDLLHYSYRDLQQYLEKSASYAAAWANQRKAEGKTASLAAGIAHAMVCFVKMYVIKAGFLDGKQGLLLCILSSHSTFVKYADLWIKTQAEPARHQSH